MKIAKKVSGSMLSSAKDAEASLARQEVADMERGIPEGHPLRNEAEKQKALIGDLSGLPPGHPLLLAMQAARERYDQQQAQRTTEQDKTAQVRKAKKVDEDRAKRESRRADEERETLRAVAAGEINKGIDGTIEKIRQMYEIVQKHEEILNTDNTSRGRMVRMKRLLFALERGVSECRIPKARA
jgi:hypothetical protein